MQTVGSVEKNKSTVGGLYQTTREYDTWPHYNTERSAGKFIRDKILASSKSSLGRRHTTFQPVRINLFDLNEDEDSENTDNEENNGKSEVYSNISSPLSASLEYDFNCLKVNENEQTTPNTHVCSKTHPTTCREDEKEQSQLYTSFNSVHVNLGGFVQCGVFDDDSKHLENLENLRKFNLSLETEAQNTEDMPQEYNKIKIQNLNNNISIQNLYVSEEDNGLLSFDDDIDKCVSSHPDEQMPHSVHSNLNTKLIEPKNRVSVINDPVLPSATTLCKRLSPKLRNDLTCNHKCENQQRAMNSIYLTPFKEFESSKEAVKVLTSNKSGIKTYDDCNITNMSDLSETELSFKRPYQNSGVYIKRQPLSDIKNLMENSYLHEEFTTSEADDDLDFSEYPHHTENSPSSRREYCERSTQATVESSDKDIQVLHEVERYEKEVQTYDIETSDEFIPVIENPFGTDTITVNSKNYFILNEVGKGGSSVVYQVFDPVRCSVVAMKCVNLPENDEMIASGFLNEVKLLKRLQGSDCVIQLYDYEHVAEKNVLYVVMESGDTDLGKLVRGIFKTQNKLDNSTIIFYWIQMLHAVQYIHNAGVIHSDLKPANFLLVSGRLKLIDFGIATSVQGDTTSVLKDNAVGTFNYMSPEAIRDVHDNSNGIGKCQYKIRYRSDVWSLGCMLYNFVYGKSPFQHIPNTFAKIAAITNPDTKINYPPCESCPEIILSTIKRCLVYDPIKRPTVTELIETEYYREESDI